MNRILIWEGSCNIRPLMMIFFIKKKTSHVRKEGRFYTTIKTQKTSTHKVHIIHPNSGTLELWEVLTWPSEDIWLAPHRCSLLGLLFCIVQVLFRACEDCVTYWWFFGIISWRRLWESMIRSMPYLPLSEQKVAWYLLVWWQPPPTIKATNRDLLP